MWRRLATSGTTPPKGRCRSTWEATTAATSSRPPRTRAAAVSSQLVSIPRHSPEAGYDRPDGPGGVPLAVVIVVQLPPHDERVLAVVPVVAAPGSAVNEA